MLYKIGDVAKILGISTDILRYYEKRGLVQPIKDTNNKYRYYDYWDINFLLDSLWFRAFDFSIEQVSNMLEISSHHDLDGMFCQKESEYRSKIEYYNMLLDRSAQHREELSHIPALLGVCELAERPEYVRYLNRYTEDYVNEPDLHRLAHDWLDLMPFTHRYFEIPEEMIHTRNRDYRWGFRLSMEYVEKLKVDIRPPVTFMPAVKSVHSVFQSTGKGGFTARHLNYMVDYARDNGLTVCGNASGVLLASVRKDEEFSGYFEAWLPVK